MAKVPAIGSKSTKRSTRPKLVHQFLIVLSGTDPLVWRRLQVPERYSFWDLHVAIQDAMGWLDYHLHEFRLLDRTEKQVVSIGIPTDDDPEDRPVIPGWDVPLSRYFERRGWHAPPAMYAYDFGDDWEHVLVHEGMESAEESLTYPRCVSGARRCPPEDCGGVHGYAEFLQAIANRRHPEHRSMLEWAEAPTTRTRSIPRRSCSTTRGSDGRRRSSDRSVHGVFLDLPRHLPLAVRTLVVFHHKPLLSRMQTLEGLHLLRDARLTKYARDGRVDVAVFVLVFTNEHEYRHFVVLPAFTPRTFSSELAQTRRRGITATCRPERRQRSICRGYVEFKGRTQHSLSGPRRP